MKSARHEKCWKGLNTRDDRKNVKKARVNLKIHRVREKRRVFAGISLIE